jgi:hypothetical protein
MQPFIQSQQGIRYTGSNSAAVLAALPALPGMGGPGPFSPVITSESGGVLIIDYADSPSGPITSTIHVGDVVDLGGGVYTNNVVFLSEI